MLSVVQAKDAGKGIVLSVFDTVDATWSALQPSGTAPSSRGGHSATLVGSCVYIFGGEDVSRRPLGELRILDLAANAWISPDTSGQVSSSLIRSQAMFWLFRSLCEAIWVE